MAGTSDVLDHEIMRPISSLCVHAPLLKEVSDDENELRHYL